ncbi:MAG: NYN domain-containing protein [Acidimicrobiales bacterium]|nr:NYN domain-containing protein [Acidimicrobiales bacterium]
MTEYDERLGVFLDYENLAIGARESLRQAFDFQPVADVLAERGRVVVRRAYADWNTYEEDRRMLARHHVELIEIPQRLDGVRKNAADIKLCVDALELALERSYVTTFVIGTGDSDFTPLVHKLREHDKRVIGLGVSGSTSALLPPACDEFLFYDKLVESLQPSPRASSDRAPSAPDGESETDVVAIVVRTLAGLQHAGDGAVRASSLKRAILRKDPTFNEADHGFRAFGELLRHLKGQGVVELEGRGDPEVALPSGSAREHEDFALLRDVVASVGPVGLSGLKNELRKRRPEFSEKQLGFGGFLQFCRAAASRGLVELAWDDAADDYLLTASSG